MKREQNGFGVVEALLFLILISILGFTGYYVYHTKNNANSSYKNAASSSSTASNSSPTTSSGSIYHDTTVGYKLTLPQGWEYQKGQQQTLDNGQPDVDTDGNPVIPPDSIMPIGSDIQSTDGISEVLAEKTSLDAKDYFEQRGFARAVTIEKQQALTIKGYSAYTVNLNQPGQGGHSTTTVVTHDGKVVQFFYYTDPSMNKNASLSEQIINSIKFD